MIIKVKYSAWSNINFKGTWELNVDDEDWAEMDENERDNLLKELVAEKLADDIGWSVEQ